MIGVLIALWWGFMLTHPWLSVPMALGILTVIVLYAYLRLTDENGPQHKASRPVSRSRAGKARAARRTRSPRDLRRAPGAWLLRRLRIVRAYASDLLRRPLSAEDQKTLDEIGWMRDHNIGGLIAANSGAPVHAPDAPGPAGLPSGERAPDGLTAVAVPVAGPGAPIPPIRHDGPWNGRELTHDEYAPLQKWHPATAPATTHAGALVPATAPAVLALAMLAEAIRQAVDDAYWRGLRHGQGYSDNTGSFAAICAPSPLEIGDYGDTDTPFAAPREWHAELEEA